MDRPEVAKERLDQMQDRNCLLEQAMADYKRLGYSDNWINQRLKSIEIRKDLTDRMEERTGRRPPFRYINKHNL